jgi:hypothetical protein
MAARYICGWHHEDMAEHLVDAPLVIADDGR